MTSDPSARLVCSDITARYGPVVVTRRIGLRVGAGEVLAILGPNGAGKTSLVSAIVGLVAATGDVLLDGEPIDNLPAHKRVARGLSFVPENRALYADMTVEENIRLGSRLARTNGESQRQRLLSQFPVLADRRKQKAGTLSGGEQQMLAIARAIVGEPRVLILDEPTQGLAPRIHDELVQLLNQLRDSGLAIVLVEQNHAFASRLADRFCVLHSGVVTLEGDSKSMANRPAIHAAYVGRTDPLPHPASEEAT